MKKIMINNQHDAEIIPFNEQESIVIASDNSGSIGRKPADDVVVDYELVSYYTFRVAYMECRAAGGIPFSLVIHNFNDKEVWDELVNGIKRGRDELGLKNLKITGSTETNFKLSQSAMGYVMIGKKVDKMMSEIKLETARLAIIGLPLVGNEVIEQASEVAPLALFKELADLEDVHLIRPISSKGIEHEVNKQLSHHNITYRANLDAKKSSGPATCFMIVYDKKINQMIEEKAGHYLQMDTHL